MIQILEFLADGSLRLVSSDDFVRRHVTPEADARIKSVKKGVGTPKVGDVVRLNNHGLEVIFGHSQGLAHMKTLKMRITQVDDESMTYPEPTFVVQVDNPEINQYLIYDRCFDIVR